MHRLLILCSLSLAIPALAASPDAPAPACQSTHPGCAKTDPGKAPPDTAQRVTVNTDGAPSIGPQDAKVTLVVFADFQCPYCRRATATVKALEARYGDRLRIVFMNRPLPIHPHAELAARAALAAQAQGRFWDFHDWLFSGQAVLERDALIDEAGRLGMDTGRFQADLDSARSKDRLEADIQEADRVGVVGTPTFFLDGIRMTGARPLGRFEELIDAELAG